MAIDHLETIGSFLLKQPIKHKLRTVALSTVLLLFILVNRMIIAEISRYEGDSRESSHSSQSCIVDLASYGYTDSPKFGYVKTSGGTSEDIFVQVARSNRQVNINRGVTLFELNATTCRTRNRQRFDTHSFSDAREQLLESLNTAAKGTIIIGVTADTAENENNKSFQDYVASFFTEYNMDLSGLKFRGKFLFILQKGYQQKTKFKIGAPHGESLKMRVTLHGTGSDVTFSQE